MKRLPMRELICVLMASLAKAYSMTSPFVARKCSCIFVAAVGLTNMGKM